MQLAVKDVARLFGVSEKTIYRWLNSRTIPAYLLNNQYRFNKSQLIEWASARGLRVMPYIMQEPESENAVLPSLAEAIEAGGIFYRVGGRDREAALRSLVETMRLPDGVDREFLLEVFLAREAYASTGIGDGIAIPHARNPVVEHVRNSAVTICFLEHPVDFSALDSRPVGVLISPTSPSVRAHLHLMGRLLFALRNPVFRAVINRVGSRQEVLQACSDFEGRPPHRRRTHRGYKTGDGSSRQPSPLTQREL